MQDLCPVGVADRSCIEAQVEAVLSSISSRALQMVVDQR